jgi:hypothetical protein
LVRSLLPVTRATLNPPMVFCQNVPQLGLEAVLKRHAVLGGDSSVVS